MIDGEMEFVRYALYDSILGEVTWFDPATLLDGTEVPGITPVGH